MLRGQQGRFVRQTVAEEPFNAFIPSPLPPSPPVALDGERAEKLERANRAIGRLDGMWSILPDARLFLYQYVRKEAVLSSQIEGTQSSLADLLLFENQGVPGVPEDDVAEVSRYIAALEHGVKRLRGGFPVSVRLIREMHAILLESGRGSEKAPGEFRRSQNWIGGPRPGRAVFVPPPAHEVPELMGQLEAFLHDDSPLPLLVRIGLAHLQFETIHPFLDGNGRIGRLLIALLLCEAGALAEPLLYLSLYFKVHRARYYDLLQTVRRNGDWEAWLDFFLDGIADTADEATETIRKALALFERDRGRIGSWGRVAGSALRVHEHLKRRPLTSIGLAAKDTGLSRPAVAVALRRLAEQGLAAEVSGRQRDRVYSYPAYLRLLVEGTEPS